MEICNRRYAETASKSIVTSDRILQRNGGIDDGIRATVDDEKTATGARSHSVGIKEVHTPLKGAIRIKTHIDLAAPGFKIKGGESTWSSSVVGSTGGHHRIDIDVVGRDERQCILAPTDNIVDLDVADTWRRGTLT